MTSRADDLFAVFQHPAGALEAAIDIHRLRGIPQDTTLYQVLEPGLASRFPPPRTMG